MDAAMMRATAHGGNVPLPPWPDLSDTTDQAVELWQEWLRQVWSREELVEAIELASPVLAAQVDALCAGRPTTMRRAQRVVVSVVKYVLRATGRPTPFGLFAGVASVSFGTETTVRWGSEHRPVARPDPVWLAEIVSLLESSRELLPRLQVIANNLCLIRGDQLVVPCREQRDGSGHGTPIEVSMRHTRPVQAVLRIAHRPVRCGDLAKQLAVDFPSVAAATIDGMLTELVARGVLLTALRPPMTNVDPLGHVLDRLVDAEAESLVSVASHLRELREIHAGLSRHNDAGPPEERRRTRAEVARRTGTICDGDERPPAVDLRLDCDVVFPEAVAREAERATELLARLTPSPFGSAAWRDYHARFLERYGAHALVPVRDLVAEAGLGFPAGYRGSPYSTPPTALASRDQALLALAQRAALDGEREVVLDEQLIAEIAIEDRPQTRQPHVELSFQLHAPDRAALDRAEFQLVVASTSRAVGTMTGRFLYLFDTVDCERMRRAYGRLPTVEHGAIPAQVSSPPVFTRTETLARAPQTLPLLVSLGEHAADDTTIGLDDLAVSGDVHRLYLMSLSRGRPVEPTVWNAVEYANFTDPVARFVCEVHRARVGVCLPFSWGAAATMPFLPRLRHGHTVLSAARWRADTHDLPGPRSSWPLWDAALSRWRRRRHVPDAVYMGDGDQRIRLDLDEPAHRFLLRAQMDRHGHAYLHEAPDASALGWFDNRPHEVVLPMASTAPAPWPPRPKRSSRPCVVDREQGHLPGTSPWLYVKLYAPANRQPALLTDHLPKLFAGWSRPPAWWYVRYHDPEPHLRLRLRIADDFAEIAARVGAWTIGLRHRGLVGRVLWDTYNPEVGRFGTGGVMDAAESVFVADSAAALAQLRASGAHPQALTAASMVDIASAFLGDIETGRRWLVDRIDKSSGPAPPRHIHDQAVKLAAPENGRVRVRELVGGEAVARGWAGRRASLGVYRRIVANDGDIGPDAVLASLLHMHHVRMHGIDDEAERQCHHLARAAALSWVARRPRSTP
ncbi:lantibiotic dehydratase [Embleya sp. NPDC020630]|uniref:lantibiotic dehydratase n=1 Tax=Embleya sp. NPDC020630 TaxID=3363979 RepID=UPI0037A32D15